MRIESSLNIGSQMKNQSRNRTQRLTALSEPFTRRPHPTTNVSPVKAVDQHLQQAYFSEDVPVRQSIAAQDLPQAR